MEAWGGQVSGKQRLAHFARALKNQEFVPAADKSILAHPSIHHIVSLEWPQCAAKPAVRLTIPWKHPVIVVINTEHADDYFAAGGEGADLATVQKDAKETISRPNTTTCTLHEHSCTPWATTPSLALPTFPESNPTSFHYPRTLLSSPLARRLALADITQLITDPTTRTTALCINEKKSGSE